MDSDAISAAARISLVLAPAEKSSVTRRRNSLYGVLAPTLVGSCSRLEPPAAEVCALSCSTSTLNLALIMPKVFAITFASRSRLEDAH